MRFLAGLGLGLCGLALVTSAVVKADDPAAPPSDAVVPQAAPVAPPSDAAVPQAAQVAPPSDAVVPQAAQVAGHNHKGLFGWRHCVECQREYAKKRYGGDVPPPPSTAAAAAMAGTIVQDQNHGAGCAACQAGTVVSGPVSVVESYPPGHAVVGGPVLAGNLPPGYAIVGGGAAGPAGVDPAPVGVSRTVQSQWNNPRLASMPPRAGVAPYDPSIQPSSMIPPQTALDTQTTTRPHILGHLFGIGGISRHIREAREDKERDAHASIAYDTSSQLVNEVPAAAVYGKGH